MESGIGGKDAHGEGACVIDGNPADGNEVEAGLDHL